MTGVNSLADEASHAVQFLVALDDHKFVFHVGGHIDHFVGDDAFFLVDLAVGGFYESVFVDPGKCSQIVDKSDVRSFRGLDRAHAAVVAVVHVSDLESCAVS